MTATAAASETAPVALTAERAFEVGAERLRDPAVVRDLVGIDDALHDVPDPADRLDLLAAAITGAAAELTLLANTLVEGAEAFRKRERGERPCAAPECERTISADAHPTRRYCSKACSDRAYVRRKREREGVAA